MERLTIDITDQKARKLIEDLEAMNVLKIVDAMPDAPSQRPAPISKFRGILSAEAGESLSKHIREMRAEW